MGVFGYTDNNGGDAVNMPLSDKRAASVREWLMQKGLKDERIEAKGFGSAKPVADNSTEAGRSRNRRVEIVLGE